MTTFRCGVNYWPARTGMRWWQRFSRDEVARDFGRMSAEGAETVRIFLLWEDFQPEPTSVSPSALSDLVAVADAAADAGLLLVPTLFTGHMSGANWLPRWATRPGPASRFPIVSGDRYARAAARNWFDDDEITSAQVLLASEAAAALRGHPAVWAWDLGNENSNVCVPGSREQARAWLSRITTALRRGDTACRVTIGLHMEDLEQDRKLGPAEAAEACDFLCMHGYPLYASWARTETDAAVPAFLAELTRWLGGKDVFFEEFGMPTRGRHEEDQADRFVAEALDGLYEAGATGAMLWCYADYASDIWAEPPFDVAEHERFFGLWRADGSMKPAGRHLGRYRDVQVRPARPPAMWIDADPTRYYDAPLETIRHLYDRYVQAAVGAR